MIRPSVYRGVQELKGLSLRESDNDLPDRHGLTGKEGDFIIEADFIFRFILVQTGGFYG